MKFNKKKCLYATIFLIILLLTPVISIFFATDNINFNDNNQTNDNFEISNFTSRLDLDEDLNETHGNQIEFFTVSKQHPWYKVWVENTSDHDYYI